MIQTTCEPHSVRVGVRINPEQYLTPLPCTVTTESASSPLPILAALFRTTTTETPYPNKSSLPFLLPTRCFTSNQTPLRPLILRNPTCHLKITGSLHESARTCTDLRRWRGHLGHPGLPPGHAETLHPRGIGIDASRRAGVSSPRTVSHDRRYPFPWREGLSWALPARQQTKSKNMLERHDSHDAAAESLRKD